jgi:hypothetical protein
MTIHRRRGGGMGWSYLGLGLLVTAFLVALALVASGAFDVY